MKTNQIQSTDIEKSFTGKSKNPLALKQMDR